MPEFAKGLGFNLTDTFTGDREHLPDFLKGMFPICHEAKPHLQYTGLPFRQ